LANHCGSDPDDDLLRYSDSAAERQPDAAPIIAIDAIERRIDGVDNGVRRCHEITRAPTQRAVVAVPPICPGGSAAGVKTMVDVVVTGIHIF
jgi:hypothetical protein